MGDASSQKDLISLAAFRLRKNRGSGFPKIEGNWLFWGKAFLDSFALSELEFVGLQKGKELKPEQFEKVHSRAIEMEFLEAPKGTL